MLSGGTGLLERDDELVAIDGALTDAKGGRGRVLLLEGRPGLGKTRLADEAADRGHSGGHQVLRASGAELEQDLGWGVVRELFSPVLAETDPRRRALLAGAAGASESLFPPGARTPAAADATGSILHGLYWLVAGLAAERPVAVVLDDVHWLDAPSARWLAHLAARVGDLPVTVLATARPSPSSTHWQTISVGADSTVFALRPLSQSASRSLLAECLGVDVNPALAECCHDVTSGNPFLLRELARELVRQSSSEAPASQVDVELVRGLQPDAIRRAVLLRLAQLGEAPRQLAFAVSILGQRATVSIAARLAGLEPEEAARAADSLAAADVLRVGARVDFVHPLVRNAIAAQIGDGVRAEWHRRAAALLAELGAPAGELALHLVASEPQASSAAVATLRVAAGEALAVGAAEMAVACLRRALAEPPPPEERVAVVSELARAEALGAPAAAVQRYRDAMAIAIEPVERARIAVELGGQLVLVGAIDEAVVVCDAARRDLGEAERELDLQLTAMALTAATLVSARPPAPPPDLASIAGATLGERFLLLAGLNAMIAGGRPMPAVGDLAEGALGAGELLDELSPSNTLYWAAVVALVIAERYDKAAVAIEAGLSASRRIGSPSGFALASCFSSGLRYRLGDLRRAEEDARSALALIDPLLDPMVHAYSLSFLVDALVESGELLAAEEALDGVAPEAAPPLIAFIMLIGSRGRVHSARGRWREAADDFLAAGARLGLVGPGALPWRSEAALALFRVGDIPQAQQLVAARAKSPSITARVGH